MDCDLLKKDLLSESTLVREPPGSGPGYWAGAPGAVYDDRDRAYYLTYRLRRPRGVNPDRGGETRVARSGDGVSFEDIFAMRKEEIGTASIERSRLQRGVDGAWHWFVSYVDPKDNRWCVGHAAAARVEDLAGKRPEIVLRAKPLDLEAIKDPYIYEADGSYGMLVSVALPTGDTTPESHRTADIYTTGECRAATGLLRSRDLARWNWEGVVLAPDGDGWDAYCRRINSVVRDGNGYFGFYDGIAGHTANYEEQTGFARTGASGAWEVLSTAAPELVSPHASGSLRYVDVLMRDDGMLIYFEVARPDGAHELRVCRKDFNAG